MLVTEEKIFVGWEMKKDLKKLEDFMLSLEKRKEKKEVDKGTIFLGSYDEFVQLSRYFQGNLVKPIHAAKMLGVSRAMIFQLEKDGKIRAFRLIFTDDVWKTIPVHLQLLISRSDVYIWIPVQDLERYAEVKGRKLKKVRGHYINEFYG